MAEETFFNQEQIPFEGLNRLGISREAFKNLPREVSTALLNGEVTPLIEARVMTSNGQTVVLPLRMQLQPGSDPREAQLMVYPQRNELENSLGLSTYELERVRAGEIIVKQLGRDGQRFPEFVQLNPETNSLVHARVDSLRLNEEFATLESIKDIQLGSQQKDAIREGKPVELKVGDEKVVVGVDITQTQGFKVVNGDMEEWKRNQEARYDIAHPEFVGFVQTDQNRWEYSHVLKADKGAANKQELDNSTSIRL